MEHKQKYVILWDILSPPINCREIQIRSPNWYYHQNNEIALKGQCWYINVILTFEVLCTTASVNIVMVPSSSSVNLRSIFLLDSNDKITPFEIGRTSFVERSIFRKCQLVLMFDQCIDSKISVKPTIWLAGATTSIMANSASNIITKNFSTNDTQFLGNIKIGTELYSLSANADYAQNLAIVLEGTDVYGGLTVILEVNKIESCLNFNRSNLNATLYIGKRLPFTVKILHLFYIQYKPFVRVHESTYPKIGNLFSQNNSIDDVIEIEQHAADLVNYTSFSKVPEMFKLFTENRLCDVTIKVKDKDIEAHKAVLCCGSAVWHELFFADEKLTGIQVTDFDYETILELIKYMYTGTISQTFTSNHDQLLMAANKYGAVILKNHCEELLATMISLETAAHLLVLADQHNAPALFGKVIAFIRKNFAAFKELKTAKSLFVQHPDVAFKMWKQFS